ncbi:MAG: hypothetical protein ACTS3F_12495 [Phycisphaerales bacterium]
MHRPTPAPISAIILAAAASCWLAPIATPQCDDPQHNDVQLIADMGAQQLLVGSGDFCDGFFVPDFTIRIFSADFINNPALPPFFQGRAFNPGFNAADGAFPPLTPVGFRIVDPLRVWDPIASNFDTIPAEALAVQTANGSATTPSEPGVIVTGPPIAISDSDGAFHVHPTFALGEPKGPGIYLLTIEMEAPSLALPPSDRLYILFNQMTDPAIAEDAAAYVEQFLVDPAPACPGDLTNDGVVDSDDLGILLGAFGATDAGDLDGNGQTDSDDLSILLSAFGAACD